MNDNIYELLKKRKLKAAIEQLMACATLYKEVNAQERIERIDEDYRLMLDYMERGFKDESRAKLFERLLRKTCQLDADMSLVDLFKHSSFFNDAYYQSSRAQWDGEMIRYTMENFVSDAAMLSLEPDETRLPKSRELHQRHQQFISVLFRKIWLSFMWNEREASFWESLLLSPTIDGNDAQVLTSALTLSLLQQFDFLKFRTLVNIYRQASDEKLRQRALVGWAFSAKAKADLFPERDEMLRELCSDDAVCRELLELQIQVFFCLNAERDRDQIQKDIMPTLLKNNNLKITRFGIEEKEDDPMQDILDPGAADRAMEEMENSVKRMMDMQKNGVDVYFGGFSMMKTFPFFGDIANWFMPFYQDHPALNTIVDKLRGTTLMENVVDNGPFCDSDKYSFALAITQVIDRLPANLKELINTTDALGPVAPPEETHSAAYIRRMYLQDLYRFYRLFPQRNELRTPFNTKIRPDNTVDTAAFFYTQKVFRQTGLESTVLELATFLANHNRLGNLYDLCSTYLYNNEGAVLTDNVKLLLLGAKACDYVGDPVAEDLYKKVLELEPDNDAALRRMGQTAFEREDYATANEFYSRLTSLDASRKSHLLGLCITLLKLGETDEAMRTIFKLDYEHPNDINVRRAKAWGLMEQGKLEQAREEYALITADKRTVDADQLNSGYCEWFMGNIEAALNHFRNYVDMQEEKDYDLRNDFLHDVNTLQRHGITDIDMVLMLELV